MNKKFIMLFIVAFLSTSAVFFYYNSHLQRISFSKSLAEMQKQTDDKILGLQNDLAKVKDAVLSLPEGYLNEAMPSDEAKRRAELFQKSQEDLLIEAVEKTSPAVVSIVVSKDVPELEVVYENPFGDDPFFQDFGIKIPRYRQKGTVKKQVGAGTGFIVSSDGLIVTNKHVVSESEAEYTVLLMSGEQKKASVLARDPRNDIAVLKIEGEGYPLVALGNSDNLRPGQSVIAIGNALGEFSNSVSVGIISGLGRSITAGSNTGQSEQLTNVIQTDAAINPGNSGGPLVNLQGEVIGVNVATVIGSDNIGFALPINEVDRIVNQIKETGKISRPYLGIRYMLNSAELQSQFSLSASQGIVLLNEGNNLAVIPGSPADKIGLRAGDILTEINGEKIEKLADFDSIFRSLDVGDRLSLKVIRSSGSQDLQVLLEELPQ